MTAQLEPLSGRVLVMTGASNGIGLCTARLAALRGARLVFVAGNSQAISQLIGLVQACGGQAMHVAADLRLRAEVVAAAHAAVERFGRIDSWINNACMALCGRLDQVSEADSRRQFDFNFWGVVNGCLAALPHLAASRGSLINVGSEVGAAASPSQGMYLSSKYAVKGFTEALKLQLEETPLPVSVSLIEPAAAGGSGLDPSAVAMAILAAAAAGRTPASVRPVCIAGFDGQRG